MSPGRRQSTRLIGKIAIASKVTSVMAALYLGRVNSPRNKQEGTGRLIFIHW